MKKKQILLCCAFFLILYFHSACKTEEDTQQFTLTVILGSGVIGTPASGAFQYDENDAVNYNYSVEEGFGNLKIILDGTIVPDTGTITMNANHTLEVTADVDIRGKWTGTLFDWYSSECYLYLTFSGGILSGDSDGGFDCVGGNGHGKYTCEGNQIEFILNYSFDAELTCTGTVIDQDHMAGNYHWIYEGCSMDFTGTWELERNNN